MHIASQWTMNKLELVTSAKYPRDALVRKKLSLNVSTFKGT